MSRMYIKVNREYTEPHLKDRVIDSINAFREEYTLEDVIDWFNCETGVQYPTNAKRLNVEIYAYPAGSRYDNQTLFEFTVYTAVNGFEITKQWFAMLEDFTILQHNTKFFRLV